MSYPPAPWTLKGYAYMTVYPIDITTAKKYIPTGLEIVQTLPGKTIGGVLLGNYQAGSTLTYGELIVIAGLVKQGGKIGSWISHIYVDNPDSIAGGREIWGLPKEEAQFFWQPNEQGGVTVRQGDQVLCDYSYGWQFNLWRQGGKFSTYSQLGSDLMIFDEAAIANLILVGSRLNVPASSPFADLVNAQPWIAVKAEAMEIGISEPRTVGMSTRIPAASIR